MNVNLACKDSDGLHSAARIVFGNEEDRNELWALVSKVMLSAMPHSRECCTQNGTTHIVLNVCRHGSDPHGYPTSWEHFLHGCVHQGTIGPDSCRVWCVADFSLYRKCEAVLLVRGTLCQKSVVCRVCWDLYVCGVVFGHGRSRISW